MDGKVGIEGDRDSQHVPHFPERSDERREQKYEIIVFQG